MYQPMINTQHPLIRVIGSKERAGLAQQDSIQDISPTSAEKDIRVIAQKKTWTIRIVADNKNSNLQFLEMGKVLENVVCIVLNLNKENQNPLEKIQAAVRYANESNKPLYVVAILSSDVYTNGEEGLQTEEIDSVLHNTGVRDQTFFQKNAGFFLVDPDFQEVRQVRFDPQNNYSCNSIEEPLRADQELTTENVSAAFHPLFSTVLTDYEQSLEHSSAHQTNTLFQADEENDNGSLESGDISAHQTNPPFQAVQKEDDNSYETDEDEDDTDRSKSVCSARQAFNVLRVLSLLAGVSTGIAGVTNEDFADSVENSWGGGIDASNDVADNGIFPWVSLGLIAFPAATYLAGYVTQKCSDLFSEIRRNRHIARQEEGQSLIEEKSPYGKSNP